MQVDMQVDSSLIGRCSTPVQNEVEKGAIRKFAEAIGDGNPLYRDAEYAASTKYGKIIAPPTFSMTFDHGEIEGFNIKQAGLIHGKQEFNYERPICAGDVISSSMKIENVYSRTGKSGKMTFVVLEQTGVNQLDELCYRNIVTIIIR
jgi:acyl dehydratase